MKKFVIFIILISVLAACAVPISASSIGDLQNQQKQADDKAKAAQDKLNKTKQQADDALKQVDKLDAELTDVNDSLDAINTRLSETQAMLLRTQLELEQATAAKQQELQAFQERARFLYVYGKMGYLGIILQSSSISDLLNRVVYVERIVAYDRDLTGKLKASELLVRTKLSNVNDQKLQIQDLQAQQQDKQAALQQTIDSKNQLLEKLQSDADMYAQELASDKAASQQISDLIKKRQAELDAAAAAAAAAKQEKAAGGAVPYSGGKVAWPLPGYTTISSPYGSRINPINRGREFHTGIDIPAPTGVQIHAAGGGTVIAAGYNVVHGYGYSILIDHGNGLATFYGHCSKLFVKSGSTVKKGQVIGNVGSTGYSTGSHLHFEVHVDGSAKNPINYLTGR